VPGPEVLVCGHVTLDRTAAGLVPGGSVYYASRAALGLGARVRALTSAAARYPSDALAGVEALVLPSQVTTLFENVHGRDGARVQRVEGAAPPLDLSRLPAAWRTPDVLHLAPVLAETPAGPPPELRARIAGLGVQGLVRRAGPDGRVEQPRWDPPRASLAGLDVAFVGEDDLRGQGELVARLAAAVPVVVLTHGARGCEVLSGGRTWRVGVFPAREVDPTGAGDVFAAAFLVGRARGLDLAAAARLGAAAASIVIEGQGGAALGRMAEAEARAAAVPVLSAP
jgi:1D-myo-inositol 3-kinase